MKKAITDFIISFLTFFISVFIQWGCVQLGIIDNSNFFNNYISLGVAYIFTGIAIHISLFVIRTKKKKNNKTS